MNELQKQKAIEALSIKKEKEKAQHRALFYHLGAYSKLHFMGVLLPYRVLYDLEKAVHEKTFIEIEPNPFYPHPAITLKTKWSYPKPPDDTKGLPLNEHGFPDFKADKEFQRALEEYQQREAAEKTPIDKWGFWYGRFLLPYNLTTFSDFDFWGEIPKDNESKQVVDSMRAACLEVWTDCKEHPENYNIEPVLRKEEHRAIYDVPYGYI